jgi:hypothetical protein
LQLAVRRLLRKASQLQLAVLPLQVLLHDLLQAHGQHAADGDPQLGLVADQVQHLLGADLQQRTLLERDDRGRAPFLAEQGHLAEEVARAARRDHLAAQAAVAEDADLAATDHVGRTARIALREDRLAGAEAQLAHAGAADEVVEEEGSLVHAGILDRASGRIKRAERATRTERNRAELDRDGSSCA